MSRTVTALYSTREEAERALQALKAEVSLAHAQVYDRSPEGESALRELDLTAEERALCDRNMQNGEHMLLAQVRSGEDPDHIIAVLERFAAAGGDAAGTMAGRRAEAGGDEFMLGSREAPAIVGEERVPIVEEELRVGTREVVRGGARVHTRVEEVPVQQDVELIEEHARVERRPATRIISEAELEQGGLLRDRVFEVAQIREEAVVTREAFVREEVVVTKSLERRVEQINDTVRRTEVDVEEFGGAGSAAGGDGHAGDRSERPL